MPRLRKSLKQRVIAESQSQRAYCHSPESLMGIAFEIDHITPRSAGGRTAFDNLCLSCPTCNRYKANRVKARDPVSRRLVRLFRPKRDNWPGHFQWDENYSLLLGLTPTGRATIEALRINRPALVLLRQYWKVVGVWPNE